MDGVITDPRGSHRPRLLLALVPLVMLVYPVLRVIGADKADVGLTVVSSSIAFLLAIYLFWGISILSLRGQWLSLIAGGLGGAIAGIVVGGGAEIGFVLASWAAVLIPGVVAGRMLAAGQRPFTVYAVGVAVLAVLTAVAWFPIWQDVYKAGQTSTDQLIAQFEKGLKSDGYTDNQINGVRDMLRSIIALTVRLTPASTVMSAILQFSLGFLWVTAYAARMNPLLEQVKPFVLWKVPFSVMPVMAIAIFARLVGNDMVKLVADNGLVILAIFYSVCGLAIVEYAMHRFGISMWARILFYVMLFFTQVVGLLMMVLLGFIDSFADWRKVSAKISLENK